MQMQEQTGYQMSQQGAFQQDEGEHNQRIYSKGKRETLALLKESRGGHVN